MLGDYLRIATGTLRRRFLRTSLTMLGIFIGIAAVVALISLGQGMQAAINQQFASVGTDKVMIQGASAGFLPPGQGSAGTVDEDDLELIRKIPGVKRAAGRLLRSTKLEYADQVQVYFGTSIPETPDERELVIEAVNLKAEQGRLLKPDDKRKVLVGYNLWHEEAFSKPIRLGSKVMLNGEKFEVVGLLKKIGAGRDDVIFINQEDAKDIYNVDKELSIIFAQVDSGVSPADVADRILKAMRRDRHQKEGFEDVTVQTSEELIDSINTVLGVVQFVFIGIALISLLVGGIGIMNTMYTSVLERRKDIGIMKAIGARNSDILWIFLIESGLLGMAGGVIGILIGVSLSKTVEIVGQGVVGDVLKANFPLSLIAGALAFSFIVGVVSGILPARQASKMHPVDALRKT